MKFAPHFEPLYDLLARLELELCTFFGPNSAPEPGFRGTFSNLVGAFFLYRVFIFLTVSSGNSTPNTAEYLPARSIFDFFIITASPLKVFYLHYKDVQI